MKTVRIIFTAVTSLLAVFAYNFVMDPNTGFRDGKSASYIIIALATFTLSLWGIKFMQNAEENKLFSVKVFIAYSFNTVFLGVFLFIWISKVIWGTEFYEIEYTEKSTVILSFLLGFAWSLIIRQATRNKGSNSYGYAR